MEYSNQTFTRRKLVNLAVSKELNPNPIGQRPPVPNRKKSIGIIDSMISGQNTGMIILRDISNDADAQKMYPGVKYLVIDGGHRIRALRDFFQGDLCSSTGSFLEVDSSFLDIDELVCVYECTASEATMIFRTINSTTPVNDIEMIMANEDSSVAKFIRSQTKAYAEYGNECHRLFDLKLKRGGNMKIPALFTAQDINPRRRWDEFVAIVLLKCIGNGNVDAGIANIESLVENDEPLSENVMNKVKTCLNFAADVAPSRGYNDKTFAAFQAVYFELGGKIIDKEKFKKELWKAHVELTGSTKTSVDDDTKKLNRIALTRFKRGSDQSEIAQKYIDIMDIDGAVNTANRTISRREKWEMLMKQGGVCAIDLKPLDLDEAEFGHTTAYSKGGSEGVIIRRSHNREMGSMAIDEYIKAKGF